MLDMKSRKLPSISERGNESGLASALEVGVIERASGGQPAAASGAVLFAATRYEASRQQRRKWARPTSRAPGILFKRLDTSPSMHKITIKFVICRPRWTSSRILTVKTAKGKARLAVRQACEV